MDNHLFTAATTLVAVLGLMACSTTPTPTTESKTETESKKEPTGPPQPVLAKTAFYEMYKPARSWAVDLLPLSLASNDVAGIKNEGGKAAMWTAVFVSPSRREARTFSYSIVDQGTTIRKGVNVGGAEAWSGPTPKSKPFQITEFAIDSDAAYKAAYEKGEAWVKKHPDKQVTLSLVAASRFPAPVWYVIWGNTKSGYAAFVNATTGLTMK
jgi:hypothetical protein